MERTEALVCILRVSVQQYMSALRVHHSVYEITVHDHAHTHTRADRDVDAAVQSLRNTPGVFTKRRAIDIGIESYGHTQFPLKGAHDITVLPRELRRSRDIAVRFRRSVHVNRSETPDAQRLDLFPFKEGKEFRHGNLRCLCRNGNLLQNLTFLVSDGTHHLCAACLQCS